MEHFLQLANNFSLYLFVIVAMLKIFATCLSQLTHSKLNDKFWHLTDLALLISGILLFLLMSASVLMKVLSSGLGKWAFTWALIITIGMFCGEKEGKDVSNEKQSRQNH